MPWKSRQQSADSKAEIRVDYALIATAVTAALFALIYFILI